MLVFFYRVRIFLYSYTFSFSFNFAWIVNSFSKVPIQLKLVCTLLLCVFCSGYLATFSGFVLYNVHIYILYFIHELVNFLEKRNSVMQSLFSTGSDSLLFWIFSPFTVPFSSLFFHQVLLNLYKRLIYIYYCINVSVNFN